MPGILSRFGFFVELGRAEEGAEEGAERFLFSQNGCNLQKSCILHRKHRAEEGAEVVPFYTKRMQNGIRNQFSCKKTGAEVVPVCTKWMQFVCENMFCTKEEN